MDPRLHLLGIRHHGPGSAASVMHALDALDPAVVLIEGAPEASGLIPCAALPGMRPPVAVLLYAADDPSLAIFSPFAEFSPEWQAMLWALRKDRPVRFIDLPAAVSLALMKEREAAALAPDPVATPGDPAGDEPPAPSGDPLDRLAEMAGYPDGEAWWNGLVETRGASIEVFSAIEDAMTALRGLEPGRDAGNAREALRERRREAHMRLEIRGTLQEADGPIAVVCGAWHVPALRQPAAISADKALLAKLPKVKVEATWVPWTDGRLAALSGYGAGVMSPGWYRHLWDAYGEAGHASAEVFAAGWQAKVAQALRAAGYSGVTASAIEAARLAISLAALRGHATPGLDEMRDATLAALCYGDETPYRVVERKLFIGERIGSIDESVPQMPLAADLARWQKRLRLKPQALQQEISLDLRSEAGLLKSTLLHRLTLIDVPWGRLAEAGQSRGTFRETWMLAWAPELSVKLAEALVHGVTVEQAGANRSVSRAREPQPIGDLAALVGQCLLADLPEAAELCIAALQAAAVNATDMRGLMQAVPPLVSVLRYGTARPYPEAALTSLVDALCAEVNAGLNGAAQNLAEDAAQTFHTALAGYDAALQLRGDEHILGVFVGELRRLARSDAADLLAGFALRRLHDRGVIDPAETAAIFSRRLSPVVPPRACAHFLEGFLDGAAEVMIQDRTLLGLVDTWLMGQDEDSFIEMLPMLRRSFSSFDAMSRRRLLLALDGQRSAPAAPPGGAPLSPAFDKALPLLLTILGLREGEHP